MPGKKTSPKFKPVFRPEKPLTAETVRAEVQRRLEYLATYLDYAEVNGFEVIAGIGRDVVAKKMVIVQLDVQRKLGRYDSPKLDP